VRRQTNAVCPWFVIILKFVILLLYTKYILRFFIYEMNNFVSKLYFAFYILYLAFPSVDHTNLIINICKIIAFRGANCSIIYRPSIIERIIHTRSVNKAVCLWFVIMPKFLITLWQVYLTLFRVEKILYSSLIWIFPTREIYLLKILYLSFL